MTAEPKQEPQPQPQPTPAASQEKIIEKSIKNDWRKRALEAEQKLLAATQQPTKEQFVQSPILLSSFGHSEPAASIPAANLPQEPQDPFHLTHANCPTCGKSTKEHTVRPFMKYCSDCGDKNPDFKDETICPNCNFHLGAIAMLPKIKNCPNCGYRGKVDKV